MQNFNFLVFGVIFLNPAFIDPLMPLTFCALTRAQLCAPAPPWPYALLLGPQILTSGLRELTCSRGCLLTFSPRTCTKLGFLCTAPTSRWWVWKVGFPLWGEGERLPCSLRHVRGAARAAGLAGARAAAARARTQQGSGPGWEPRRRPRAGAGAGAGVPAARSVQLGPGTARPGGGATASAAAPPAPPCGREEHPGRRRSKVTKTGRPSCLPGCAWGSALSWGALAAQPAALGGTL
jgi:hypothetical protein